MRTYYRVVCSEDANLAGAGLGYEEIYGGLPRYFWSLADAEEIAAQLNEPMFVDELVGAYSVEERRVYDDGSWDDSGDAYAREQLAGGEADR